MKKLIVSAVVASVAAVMLTGCTGIMSQGGGTFGYLYSQVDGAGSRPPVGETASTSKVGTAESTGILCFATGNSSLQAAMQNGGITKIHHVDYKVTNVLGGLYIKYTTVVYGE